MSPRMIVVAGPPGSVGNLPRAIEETDQLWIYDNSRLGGPPRLVMECKEGGIAFLEIIHRNGWLERSGGYELLASCCLPPIPFPSWPSSESVPRPEIPFSSW